MSVGTSAAIGIAAGLGTAGSLGGALIGAHASSKAADQQADQANKALAFQQGVYNDTKANQQPFIEGGQYSLGQLLAALKNGTFEPGTLPTFTAPTLEEARNTPGYQFTREQGEQGIERGAAAAGGAFTGGTLKALAGFNSGLADSTYGDVFNRAMASYNAQLAGYGTKLASQNQIFNQLSALAGLGENAAANEGNNGAQAASTIGNTLTGLGNTQAAATIGGANALIAGLNGATNSAALPFYLQYLRPPGTPSVTTGTANPFGPAFQPTGSGEGTVTLANPFAGGG